jgi:hypothetical protein
MCFHLDIGYSQLNKKGEEICGDSIEVLQSDDSSIIVLADGLASGIKASILSRITAKTAATLLKAGCHIEDVIETMAETLPVDSLRNLAYSTFSILQVFKNGQAYLVEFDSPPSYFGQNGLLKPLERSYRTIENKRIAESYIDLQDGNWLVLISDGVLHAGIGNVLNTGWGEHEVGRFIRGLAAKDYDAVDWANEVTEKCDELYGGSPGDDVSVAVVKIRKARKLTALIGPPRDSSYDRRTVEKLVESEGKKVVCGGTTSLMVSRVLKKSVEVNFDTESEKVPPTGSIEGIDLVTEGAITIYYALEHLKSGVKLKNLDWVVDGAGLLAMELLKADEVHFMVGLAINKALHYPGFPVSCVCKNQTVRDLAEELVKKGKKVAIEYI